jgi:hypothetical protein
MPLPTFHVQVGDHAFLEEGGEEIGAVRKLTKDHLVGCQNTIRPNHLQHRALRFSAPGSDRSNRSLRAVGSPSMSVAPLQFLMLVFAGWVNRRQVEILEYLREENRVLRARRRVRRRCTRGRLLPGLLSASLEKCAVHALALALEHVQFGERGGVKVRRGDSALGGLAVAHWRTAKVAQRTLSSCPREA